MKQIRFYKKLCKGITAYNNYTELQNYVVSCEEKEIEIIFPYDGRMGRTFTFLLGCLPLLARQFDKTILLTLPPKAFSRIKAMNIYDYYSNPQTKTQRFEVLETPYDAFRIADAIIDELPVNFEPDLKEEIVGHIGEMYNNAFDHSKAQFKMGGKYFKTSNSIKKYCFSCYDTGIGIISKVQQYKNLNDKDALEWALARGNTTKTFQDPTTPGGLGLHRLHEFANINQGSIRICSSSILYEYRNGISKFSSLKNNFRGSLFEMDVIPNKMDTYGYARV